MVMDIDVTASHVDLIYFFLSEGSACVKSRRGESLEKVSSGIAGHIPSFRTISLRSSFDTRLRRTCPSSTDLSSQAHSGSQFVYLACHLSVGRSISALFCESQRVMYTHSACRFFHEAILQHAE